MTMTVDEAIEYINRHRAAKYSRADVDTIRRVLDELGLSQFEGRQDGDFFSDVDDRVHVHPTMIVIDRPVHGSVLAGTYDKWPHRVELDRWPNRQHSSRSDSARVGMCQSCFNPLDERHAEGCY